MDLNEGVEVNAKPSLDSFLEDDYADAYKTWQSDQSPAGNAAFMSVIDPIVQKGVKMYGDDSPITASKARLLALNAARSYNPKRSRLQSHVLTHMQGLQRMKRQQQEVIRMPERMVLEQHRLRTYEQELADELGRPPSDNEISDKLGISSDRLSKIRRYGSSLSGGQLSQIDPDNAVGSSVPGDFESRNAWVRLVHHDLAPLDQQILELTLGLNGTKKLSNAEIARRLGRSPGAISQRKLKIQELLDQEKALSPFI